MIIDLSDFHKSIQSSYEDFFWNKKRIIVLCGGAGAGKSYAAHQKTIFRAISEKSPHLFIIRKTGRSHRTSTFPVLVDLIDRYGLKNFCRINKSDLSIEFLRPFSGIINFLGLDDVEKIKSLVDPAEIFVEEASEITYNDFLQLNTRLRGPNCAYHQLILAFNPVGGQNSWLNRTFFKKRHKQADVYKCTVYNNSYIDSEYIKTLELQAKENPEFGKIYLNGEFTNPTGVIFTNWSTLNYGQFPNSWDWCAYGVDFGFNDPTTIIKVSCSDQNLYISELLYESKLTTNDIKNFIKNETDINKDDEIYCDSAEPDRIKEFRDSGLNAIPAKKGPNSILEGINKLKNHKIYLNENSTNLINEFSTYAWKKNLNGDLLDSPIDSFNHTIDSIRYVINTKFAKEESFDPNLDMISTNFDVLPE